MSITLKIVYLNNVSHRIPEPRYFWKLICAVTCVLATVITVFAFFWNINRIMYIWMIQVRSSDLTVEGQKFKKDIFLPKGLEEYDVFRALSSKLPQKQDTNSSSIHSWLLLFRVKQRWPTMRFLGLKETVEKRFIFLESFVP